MNSLRAIKLAFKKLGRGRKDGERIGYFIPTLIGYILINILFETERTEANASQRSDSSLFSYVLPYISIVLIVVIFVVNTLLVALFAYALGPDPGLAGYLLVLIVSSPFLVSLIASVPLQFIPQYMREGHSFFNALDESIDTFKTNIVDSMIVWMIRILFFGALIVIVYSTLMVLVYWFIWGVWILVLAIISIISYWSRLYVISYLELSQAGHAEDSTFCIKRFSKPVLGKKRKLLLLVGLTSISITTLLFNAGSISGILGVAGNFLGIYLAYLVVKNGIRMQYAK